MEERSFAKVCGQCRQRTMTLQTIAHRLRVDHDGRKYEVVVPDFTVPKCTNCGAISIDAAADAQVDRAFRQQAGLLHGEEIRHGRQVQLGLRLQELAEYLGISSEVLERWENGAQIQPLSQDNWLRALFALPELRAFLTQLQDARAEQPAGSV